MVSVRFTIPAPPTGKERPRLNPKTGKFYTPRKTQAFERAVAWAAMVAGFKPQPEVEYGISIQVPMAYRGDLDNVVKAVCDGLNKLEGFDDQQVGFISGARNPRVNAVRVTIWPVERQRSDS